MESEFLQRYVANLQHQIIGGLATRRKASSLSVEVACVVRFACKFSVIAVKEVED